MLAVTGARLLVASGRIHDPDAPFIESAMQAGYARMRADEADPGSAVHDAAPPIAPDLIVYEGARRGETAILFLHGYGGRFALPCWQVASAVAPLGVTTACPSIGAEGDWWTEAGERGVRTSVDALRAAGYRRIVLAGLSNGAIGASRLAARLRSHPRQAGGPKGSPMAGTFAGLVLVSGADPGAPPPGVPALVITGRRDAMSSPANARAYARRARATFVEVDAGHFAMLRRADQVERAVHDFVASLP